MRPIPRLQSSPPSSFFFLSFAVGHEGDLFQPKGLGMAESLREGSRKRFPSTFLFFAQTCVTPGWSNSS